MSATVYHISKELEMASYIHETVSLPGCHTGVNIVQKMKDVLSKFEIEDSKVLAIVHDQGSNVQAAGQIFPLYAGDIDTL